MRRSAPLLSTLVTWCFCTAAAAQVPPPKGPSVSLVEKPASLGAFQQAYSLTFAVLSANPPEGVLANLREIYARYPQIREAGFQHANRAIADARTEKDLISAQAEVRGFARLQGAGLCDFSVLAGLQVRYVARATALILDAGVPVTFESNLLADWTAATGREMDPALERRICDNTMACIANNLARSAPSPIAVVRLRHYLERHPEARAEAFETLKKVEWSESDLAGPVKALYPEFAEERLKGFAAKGTEERLAGLGAKGEGQFGEALQLDTKGVEFGPWVRRFLAQVRRNWFIPSAAMSLRGHVAVSFNVHKDGTISDVTVTALSDIDEFNRSSLNAIAASNPSVPLPPEYPEDRVFITVTFYYNDMPPQKR